MELMRHEDFCSGCAHIRKTTKKRGRLEKYKKEFSSEAVAGQRDGEVAAA